MRRESSTRGSEWNQRRGQQQQQRQRERGKQRMEQQREGQQEQLLQQRGPDVQSRMIEIRMVPRAQQWK